MREPRVGMNCATRKATSQLKVVQREEETAWASGGINSTLRIQGMGPRPRENMAMKAIRQTRGRKPILSINSLETLTELGGDSPVPV